MPDLQQAALARLRFEGLPQFAGASVPEQLQNGRDQARVALLKYVPGLKFDLIEARDVMSHVDAWVERNQDDLAAVMATPEKDLPQWLQTQLGNSDQVQQWVIANFTVAAAGMGPWMSGRIASLVQSGDVTQDWADHDAAARLDAFAMIVKMDADGDLEFIFRGPNGVGAFGVAPVVVWAIVVAAVAIAAVVATYFFIARRLELNNALMRDICKDAQARGDTATVQKCIEATRDIQVSTPWAGLTKELGKVALILGGGYIAFRYGLPFLIDQGLKLRERLGKKTATANPWEIVDMEFGEIHGPYEFKSEAERDACTLRCEEYPIEFSVSETDDWYPAQGIAKEPRRIYTAYPRSSR